MTALSDGMRRLIEPWTLTVTVGDAQRTQHFPPLVDMLRAQLIPGMEGGAGGSAPNTRNILDVKSLDLIGHIEDVTGAWLQEWGVPRAGELKLDLRGFWDRTHTLYATGDIDELLFERLTSFADTWGGKIWDLMEPPKQVPLRNATCPKCGETKISNGEGELSDALTVTFRLGLEPTAECRTRECGGVWIGRKGLIDLGREMGQEIDFDALEELFAENVAQHG